jgi:hypothetical protein
LVTMGPSYRAYCVVGYMESALPWRASVVGRQGSSVKGALFQPAPKRSPQVVRS